jgi:hypothetical protein
VFSRELAKEGVSATVKHGNERSFYFAHKHRVRWQQIVISQGIFVG